MTSTSSYYDWGQIVKSKSDSELKKIFRERNLEHIDKVNAVIQELKNRNLINSDEAVLPETPKETIYDFNEITRTRPNLKRADIAQYIIWAILILEVISIYSSVLQYNLLVSVQNGGFLSDHKATLNDMRELIIGIIYFAAYIVSGVTFIQWFRRAYFNLHQRISGCTFSEVWASGAWFVPIVSLFRPYNIMDELRTKSDKIIQDRTGNQFTDHKTGLLGFWWALWILSSVIGQIVMRMSFRSETLTDYINGTIGDIILSIVGIPLAYITIMVIKGYSKKEEVLYLAENGGIQ